MLIFVTTAVSHPYCMRVCADRWGGDSWVGTPIYTHSMRTTTGYVSTAHYTCSVWYQMYLIKRKMFLYETTASLETDPYNIVVSPH